MRQILPLILLLPACSPDGESGKTNRVPAPADSRAKADEAASVSNASAGEPAEVAFKKLGWDGSRYTFKTGDAGAAVPFTGTTTDYYPSGQLKARYGLKDGVYHGLVEEWYPDGQQKTKTSYESGKHQGDNFYWNPDGTLQVHKVWKDDVLVQEIPGNKP